TGCGRTTVRRIRTLEASGSVNRPGCAERNREMVHWYSGPQLELDGAVLASRSWSGCHSLVIEKYHATERPGSHQAAQRERVNGLTLDQAAGVAGPAGRRAVPRQPGRTAGVGDGEQDPGFPGVVQSP